MNSPLFTVVKLAVFFLKERELSLQISDSFVNNLLCFEDVRVYNGFKSISCILVRHICFINTSMCSIIFTILY